MGEKKRKRPPMWFVDINGAVIDLRRCSHPICYDADGHTDGCLFEDDDDLGIIG